MERRASRECRGSDCYTCQMTVRAQEAYLEERVGEAEPKVILAGLQRINTQL